MSKPVIIKAEYIEKGTFVAGEEECFNMGCNSDETQFIISKDFLEEIQTWMVENDYECGEVGSGIFNEISNALKP